VVSSPWLSCRRHVVGCDGCLFVERQLELLLMRETENAMHIHGSTPRELLFGSRRPRLLGFHGESNQLLLPVSLHILPISALQSPRPGSSRTLPRGPQIGTVYTRMKAKHKNKKRKRYLTRTRSTFTIPLPSSLKMTFAAVSPTLPNARSWIMHATRTHAF